MSSDKELLDFMESNWCELSWFRKANAPMEKQWIVTDADVNRIGKGVTCREAIRTAISRVGKKKAGK
jgi:hypothetical protein